MKSSKLKIIILGILDKQSCHAYKIEKIIEKEQLREGVNIGFSTIYSVLKKLEDQSLLESKKVEQDNSPPRKVYHLNQAGRNYLKNLLETNLSQTENKLSNFEIALHYSDSLSKKELQESLQKYKKDLNTRIKHIIKKLTQLSAEEKHKKDILNRSLRMLRAEQEWLKELLL